MLTYVKWFLDQRFSHAHFDSEQILGEYAEVDTVRLLGELDRLVFIDDQPNVGAFSYILNRFTIRRVVHQLVKVFLCFVSAIRLTHFSIVFDVAGYIV